MNHPSIKRSWIICFDEKGKAGERKTLHMTLACDFVGTRMLAADSGTPAGGGARVHALRIAGVPQYKDFWPRHTVDLSWTYLPGWRLSCREGQKVEVDVEFLQDCYFSLQVIGYTELPQREIGS